MVPRVELAAHEDLAFVFQLRAEQVAVDKLAPKSHKERASVLEVLFGTGGYIDDVVPVFEVEIVTESVYDGALQSTLAGACRSKESYG